jgi:hypothetical protein
VVHDREDADDLGVECELFWIHLLTCLPPLQYYTAGLDIVKDFGMKTRVTDEALIARYTAECAELAARLSAIRFIWPGTIQWRMMTCGKASCACHSDPGSRHGPYPYWTTKKAQKTVTKLLDPEEARLLEEWIENRRALEKVVGQIKQLSRKAVKPALRLRTRKENEEPPGG